MIDDGRTWLQGDAQLCATYPTTMWQPDENVIQKFRLTVPGDLPAGAYVMALGVYEAGPNGARLPVTAPQHSEKYSYVVLQYIQVGK